MKSKYSNLTPLWMAVFSDIIGFSLLITVYPSFAEQFNVTPLIIGLISSVNGLFSFISAPIWGRLSDKFGRKPMLLIAQLGTLSGFIVLAFSNSFEIILLSRIIDGIFGGNLPIANAVISDVVEPKDMAKQMTNIGIAHNVANLFGPAIGGIFFSQYGIMGPGLAAAATSIFTFIITYTKLKETAPIKTGIYNDHQNPNIPMGPPIITLIKDDKPNEKWYNNQPLVRALIIFAFSTFGFMTIMSNISMFALLKVGLDAQAMGIFLMISASVQIVIRFSLYVPLLKKWGEYKMATVGFIIYLIEFILFVFVNQPWFLLIVLLMHSFATSATRGVLSSFISILSNPRERGKIQGISSSLDTFAQIIGPIIGGAILTYLRLEWFTSMSWVCMLISLILLLSARDMRKALKEHHKKFSTEKNLDSLSSNEENPAIFKQD